MLVEQDKLEVVKDGSGIAPALKALSGDATHIYTVGNSPPLSE
jgi:hypothetical protein